jgi:hypothetical protein
MTIAREEIFGPVLCVLAYQDKEEAISREWNIFSCLLARHCVGTERASEMGAGQSSTGREGT